MSISSFFGLQARDFAPTSLPLSRPSHRTILGIGLGALGLLGGALYFLREKRPLSFQGDLSFLKERRKIEAIIDNALLSYEEGAIERGETKRALLMLVGLNQDEPYIESLTQALMKIGPLDKRLTIANLTALFCSNTKLETLERIAALPDKTRAEIVLSLKALTEAGHVIGEKSFKALASIENVEKIKAIIDQAFLLFKRKEEDLDVADLINALSKIDSKELNEVSYLTYLLLNAGDTAYGICRVLEKINKLDSSKRNEVVSLIYQLSFPERSTGFIGLLIDKLSSLSAQELDNLRSDLQGAEERGDTRILEFLIKGQQLPFNEREKELLLQFLSEDVREEPPILEKNRGKLEIDQREIFSHPLKVLGELKDEIVKGGGIFPEITYKNSEAYGDGVLRDCVAGLMNSLHFFSIKREGTCFAPSEQTSSRDIFQCGEAIGVILGAILRDKDKKIVIGQTFHPLLFEMLARFPHANLFNLAAVSNSYLTYYKISQDDFNGFLRDRHEIALSKDRFCQFFSPLLHSMANFIGRRRFLHLQEKGVIFLMSQIQGKLSERDLLGSLEFPEGENGKNLKTYFTKWVGESDLKCLSTFVFAATGQIALSGKKIKIVVDPHLEHCPSFQTCFMQAAIPAYPDYETFSKKLETSLTNCESGGFQME